MKTNVYDHKGTQARTIDLPESLFGLGWNADLVHQVAVGMQSNARANTAHTKDRSEVSGGGKKPWRQKGTGQARHGSRRSPIWVGGGTTFGPRTERNYDKKINEKMRKKALLVALSEKMRNGQILFVEGFDGISGTTKEVQGTLLALAGVVGFETLNTEKHNNVFMTTPGVDDLAKRGAKNLAHVTLAPVENLNVLDVLNHRYLVMTNPEKTVEFLETKLTTK